MIAWAGVTSSSAMLLAGAPRSPRINSVADGLVCLNILIGFWLFAAAIASKVQACSFCIAFWIVQIGLFAELLSSSRATSKVASFLPFAGAIVIGMTYLSPEVRWQIANQLPVGMPAQTGPQVGDRFPSLPGVRDSGILVLATDCLPCAKAVLEPRVRQMLKEGQDIQVLAAKKDEETIRMFKSAKIQTVPSEFFRQLHMRPDGPPLIVQLKAGVVTAAAPPSTFRPVGNPL